MRGSKWELIKPLLKTLQEFFPAEICVALIIKPDNFWQKQKTNFGSAKFSFEVSQWASVLLKETYRFFFICNNLLKCLFLASSTRRGKPEQLKQSECCSPHCLCSPLCPLEFVDCIGLGPEPRW